MRESKGQIIAALDIGSTKVVMAIACMSQGDLEVIGLGKAENTGVRQGQIVNMVETQAAIMSAKEEAELMAGVKVSSVFLSIGGQGVKSLMSHGLVPISQEEVSPLDIKNALKVAEAIQLPEQSRILHALPRTYKVDDQEDIDSPVSMKGVRLEVEAQLITMPEKRLQNRITCVEKSGLKIQKVVLDPYASSQAILSEDEKEAGVAVVEIGGGTCEIIVFKNSHVQHVGSIPVGGQNFTQDVAVGLKTPMSCAEQIKRKQGTALADMVGEDEVIEVVSLGERKNRELPRSELTRILEARAEETLSLIFNQLNDWDVLKDLSGGVVLSGGGSLLHGLVELSEFTFDVPVRRATPQNVQGLRETYSSPVYSTVIGTLMYGCHLIGKGSVKPKSKSPAEQLQKEARRPWEEIKRIMSKALSI